MIYSINLDIRSQSVTPDFRNSNMGQIEKDSGLLCALFDQQVIVDSNSKQVIMNDS